MALPGRSRPWCQCLLQRLGNRTVNKRGVHSDDYRKVPQSKRQFPRLEFNNKPLVKSPNMMVFSEIVISGKTHTKEVNPQYSKDTGRPSLQVYEGARMAASAVTEAIARGHSMADFVTPQLAQQLTALANTDEVSKNPDLISMPEEDILAAWVDHISRDDATGEYTALLVTYSFPGFGFIQRRLKDNVAREKEFRDGLNEKIATSPKSKETSEDLAKSVLAFKETLFEPNAFFTHLPIVLSNFRFVWRNDGWLLDGLQMTDSKEAINPLSHFRWKGRLALALKWQKSYLTPLRLDYFTDLIILSLLLAMVMAK